MIKMKVALAQINPFVGNLEENSNKIISYIRRARQMGADLVVFPELALVGYPPEDLLLKPHFIEKNIRCLKAIKKESKGLASLVGFVDKKKDLIYNACALIQDGQTRDAYHKIYLPNYGVFDEKRYFTPGAHRPFYGFKGCTFTVSICEEIWSQNFINSLKGKNLDFVINISASPFHLGKIAAREKVLSAAAKQLNSFVLYCNLAGGQDELVFDGTSEVYSPQGKLAACAKRFAEDLLIVSLDRKKKYLTKRGLVKEEEEAFSALCLGLADYVRKNGFKKVVIGVSGGIDSAVTVSLAALSLGKDNVHALIMPSPYTSSGTFGDAKKMCHNLGVKYTEVNIEDIFNSYLKAFSPFFKKGKTNKAEENIQARIRGNILMAFSNKFGYLVLNTGNKSEVSCGYCTLYGDMVGGFGVLKDVPKLLVYKLARYINKKEGRAIIPNSVLQRPPSAELKPNQLDTDALPPYQLLDPILKLYVEEDYSLDKIVEKGFKKDLVRGVIKMVDTNEYKRRQAPVGIKITPRAFGKDRRMPITNRFFE
ncbi:MAG: NAD+ synthase [Candidatus Omnitrophota bacterium]|nr:MAG: NAD+ synthase [Candidatus Omnitrophota bacterium]